MRLFNIDAVDKQDILTKIVPASSIILFIILMYIFGFSPNLKKLKMLNSGIHQLKQDIAGEARLVSNVEITKLEIGEIKARISGFRKESFPTLEVSPILRRLTETASSLRMEFISVKPLPAVRIKQDEKAGYSLSELPLELELKGSYDEALSFLKQIESSDGTSYRVDKLEITDIPQEVKKHNVKLSLSAFAYVEDEAKGD